MIRRLYPQGYLESVYDLELDTLKKEGIKGIIFDIDNTLVPYDEKSPNDKLLEFFKKLEVNGFTVALVSNNNESRVALFNKDLKFVAYHKACKPLIKNFNKVVKELGFNKEEVIMVGDQIFTDVYGGNLAGIRTYLVKPISDKDEWVTKIKRGVEKKILKRYLKQNQNK